MSESGSSCDREKACQSSSTGCARCEAVSAGPSESALLLGPQDRNVEETLRQVLAAAQVGVTRVGPLFGVQCSRPDLPKLAMLLEKELTVYTRDCIRAAYAPAGVTSMDQALTAFIFAEPLSAMIRKAEHEWVRDALAHDWLYSVFHPIIETVTGNLFAQECLIRAKSPETGSNYGAGQIINACEALNLQHQLDQRARQVAIRGASQHIGSQTKIFINFLPNTIYDPKICLRTTMEAAKQYNVSLSRLVFEVVETEKIGDMKQLLRILNYYRERGVGTAVDDMGAGYASIEYIAALKPQFVKLDRELVVKAENDRESRRAIDSVVKATHEIAGRVIAEGIETQAQHDLAIEAGCDFVQGFRFCKPECPPAQVQFTAQSRRAAA